MNLAVGELCNICVSDFNTDRFCDLVCQLNAVASREQRQLLLSYLLHVPLIGVYQIDASGRVSE